MLAFFLSALFLLYALAGASDDLHGDSWCGSLMCVSAIINDTSATATYQLKALNQLGWMAMGFGDQMAGAAMVILWPNPDGSITLSQRTAPGLVEPTVVDNPPRNASLYPPLTSLSAISPTIAISLPMNSDTNQSLIWAFSMVNPESNDPGTFLLQHLDSGNFSLNLTKDLSGEDTTPTQTLFSAAIPSETGVPGAGHGPGMPLYEKLIITHAIFCTLGMLVILPLGTLVARWGRTFSQKWFNFHWTLQVIAGVPVILLGWTLGPLAVTEQGFPHVNDTHKVCGVLLLILFLFQLCLGSYIHFRKPTLVRKLHPPQNIVHAVLGVLIIGLAFFQVRTGFSVELPIAMNHSINTTLFSNLWIAWLVFVTITYLLGFALIRKQLESERALPPPYVPSPRLYEASGSTTTGIRELLELGPTDDGTHDIYSEHPLVQNQGGIEMREVVPLSSVILSRN